MPPEARRTRHFSDAPRTQMSLIAPRDDLPSKDFGQSCGSGIASSVPPPTSDAGTGVSGDTIAAPARRKVDSICTEYSNRWTGNMITARITGVPPAATQPSLDLSPRLSRTASSGGPEEKFAVIEFVEPAAEIVHEGGSSLASVQPCSVVSCGAALRQRWRATTAAFFFAVVALIFTTVAVAVISPSAVLSSTEESSAFTSFALVSAAARSRAGRVRGLATTGASNSRRNHQPGERDFSPETAAAAAMRANSRQLSEESLPTFGTIAGYDTLDGGDAICWQVPPLSSTPKLGGATERRTLMLPKCWNGTDLDVVLSPSSHPSPPPPPPMYYNSHEYGVFYAGRTYYVGVYLTVDPRSLPYVDSDAVELVTNFRLVLCKQGRVGFCHPFVDSGRDNGGNVTALSNGSVVDVWKQQVLSFATNDGGNGKDRRPSASRSDEGYLVSEFGEIKLPDDDDGDNDWPLTVNATLPLVLPEGSAGDYFVIGHVAFSVPEDNTRNSTASKMDIADAIPFNIITLKDEPVVHSITNPFKITMSVIAALCFAWQCFLLLSIWRNRDSVVMRVAQAPFLALIASSGATIAASSVFFMPLNDAFCNLRDPLILVPSSLIGSIMVGRIWRAYWVLSTVLSFAADDGNTRTSFRFKVMNFLSNLADWDVRASCSLSCCCCRGEGEYDEALSNSRRGGFQKRFSEQAKTLRGTVTNRDLLRLIAALTLPQCVLQIVHLVVFPERVHVDLNEEGTAGITTCTTDGLWLTFCGLMLVVAVFLLSILASWAASDLPTVFNEKDSIFTASWISVVLVVIAGVILLTTQSLMLHPNISALLWMLFIISLGLITSWLLIMPKLRKVWNGEQVILSAMLNADSQPISFPASTHDGGIFDSGATNGSFSTRYEHSSGVQQEPRAGTRTVTEADKAAASLASASDQIVERVQDGNHRSVSFGMEEEKQEEEASALCQDEGIFNREMEEVKSDNSASPNDEERLQDTKWVYKSVRSALTWTSADSVNDGTDAEKSSGSGGKGDELPVPGPIPQDINLVQRSNRRSVTWADANDSDDELTVDANKGNRRSVTWADADSDDNSEAKESNSQLSHKQEPPVAEAAAGRATLNRGSYSVSCIDSMLKAVVRVEQSSRSAKCAAITDPTAQKDVIVDSIGGSEENRESAPGDAESGPSPGQTEHSLVEQAVRRRHRGNEEGKKVDKRIIRQHEAPPPSLEKHMFRTKEAIQRVNNYTLNGTQPPLETWAALRKDSASLARDLKSIDFGWTQQDENREKREVVSRSWVAGTSRRGLFSVETAGIRSTRSLGTNFRLRDKKSFYRKKKQMP